MFFIASFYCLIKWIGKISVGDTIFTNKLLFLSIFFAYLFIMEMYLIKCTLKIKELNNKIKEFDYRFENIENKKDGE